MKNRLACVNWELERKVKRHCCNPDILCYPNKSKDIWEEVGARVNTKIDHTSRMWFRGHRILFKRYFVVENC